MLCKCLFARFSFVFVCCLLFSLLFAVACAAHAKRVAYFSARLDMPAICG